MKNALFLSYLLIFIFASSCNYESEVIPMDCCLSSEDSLLIVNEIIETTDAYAMANNRMDAEECAEFWDSSSDFVFAETGVEYPNWDSLYNDIKRWYSQPLDSVQLHWIERSIIPLNQNAAKLYGKISFKARYESGEIFESRATVGVLLERKNEKWKTTIGYWYLKPVVSQ